MTQPEDFNVNPNLVKLNKSNYDLKQSSRMWNNKITGFITKKWFQKLEFNNCLYIYFEYDIYIQIIYVNDILVIGTNIESIQNVRLILGN